MRDYARSLKIVLLIVIVVFILTSGVLFYFGTGPFEGARSNAVAVVNGEEIPFERFRRAQSNLIAAYERMSRQRLTPELAERIGLSQQVVNELRSTIQQIREFQENGRFSRDEYLKVLKQLRLDPGEFESEVRRQLIRRKMETLIKQGVKVSDEEIRQAYYQEHAAEFEEPKRLRVAHVLVRVPPVGGSEAENAAKAKVEDVIKRAKGGEDFAKLAREISEDKASAVQGGDLGFVGPGELVAPFEQAAFALKKGEISAPVRTPFGYHAIRVIDVKEGGKTPLKEVAPKIKETLGAQKSEQAAQTRADEARASLLSAKEFPAEAKRLGLEAQEATFGRGDALGEAGRDPQLDETLFGLAVGGVSMPIKTAGGFAIVKVVQHIPAGVPPVAEIRERVMEAIKRERAEQQVTDRAKALITTLGKGGDFAETAKADGFRIGGVYVVKTLERAAAAADGLEKERPALEKQVLEEKRALAWDNWIRGRLAGSKVQVGGQPATLTR